MKKNVVQDVVPSKKSIRDVDISRSRNMGDIKKTPKYAPKDDPFVRPVSINSSKEQRFTDSPIRIEQNSGNNIPPRQPNSTSEYKYEYPRPKKSKKYLYFLGVIAVLVFAVGLSSLFKSADIKITPKQDTKALNESFSAKKDSVGNGLSYQLVTVSKEVEKSIDPKDVSSEQKVEKKARGTIVIYNNFGELPQKLVATTRFQTPDGMIFRLVDAVTVPGYTKKDGKTIAGSVETIVEADKPGSDFNIGLKDFTIPGLKTDPAKYKQIYGRSKTEMTGGFSGMQKTVSKDVLAKAETEMEASLKAELFKDIVTQIPGEFVLYEKSLTYKFDPAVTTNTSSGSVLLKKKGITNAVMFDKSLLTKSILTKVFPDAPANTIKITNLSALDFVLSTSSQNTANSIVFTLKGDAKLEWVFDENKLKNDLLGLSKKNANAVLANYPSIKEAWITTRPFWNNTVPKDANKVKMINTSSLNNTSSPM